MTNNSKQFDIINEMKWILEILLSSTSSVHIEVCDRLFINFLKKWGLTSQSKNEKYINSYNGIKFVVNKKIKRDRTKHYDNVTHL
jgi:hypothetical protein